MNLRKKEGARPLLGKRAAKLDVPHLRGDSSNLRFDAQANWTPPDISRCVRLPDGTLHDPDLIGLGCAAALYNAGQPESLDRLLRSMPGYAKAAGWPEEYEDVALYAMANDDYWETLDADAPDDDLPEHHRHIVSYGPFSNKAIKRAARASRLSVDEYTRANREMLEAAGRVFTSDGTLNYAAERYPHVSPKQSNNDSIPQWQKDKERVDDWKREGRRREQARAQEESREERGEEEPKVYIELLTPSQIKTYEPPPGIVLVGTNHVVRGNVVVVAGPPGVGKSRALVGLAEAGATGYEWFGYAVHTKFKTLIVQSENGRYRLKLEFADLDEKLLDPYLRITPPPPLGLCFGKREFREQLKAHIEAFRPDLVEIDPWNSVARDDKAKDYLESFDLIRDVIPPGEDGPALAIAAHTRKPSAGERANGRALLNLIAGSYVLTSVPRCVFVLQHASDAVDERRVVVTCCKNSDGELGARSVWSRENGIWTRIQEFDWEEWDNPTPPSKRDKAITAEQMAAVFNGGSLTRKEAVDKLMALTGKKKQTCYNATGADSPFEQLYFDKKTKLLSWMK